MIENDVEKLIRKSLRFFRRIIYIHVGFAVAMITVGAVAAEYSVGTGGTTSVPYFFGIFISAIGHLVLIGLDAGCIKVLTSSAKTRRYARRWIMAYSMTCSILVLWDAMGIVFTVVNGICSDGQLCYYDTNMEVNRVMVGIIIFLHSLTMVMQIIFARKTHQYENEFHNDLSIRLGQDWVLTKRKPLHSFGSTGSFHTSSRRSSVESIHNDEDNEKSEHKVPVKTIVVIEADYRKFPPVPVAEEKILSRHRSKSIPNMRKHPEMLAFQPDLEGGTAVSIYSDSEARKTDAQKLQRRRLVKHSHRRSKSDGGTCTERPAGQVRKNGEQEVDSIDTINGDVTPVPDHDTGVIVDEDKSDKHKHKHHKKHKKHKKTKKSRVMPEPEDQELDDKISAWDGASEAESETETQAKTDSPNTLIQKHEKLQADQVE